MTRHKTTQRRAQVLDLNLALVIKVSSQLSIRKILKDGCHRQFLRNWEMQSVKVWFRNRAEAFALTMNLRLQLPRTSKTSKCTSKTVGNPLTTTIGADLRLYKSKTHNKILALWVWASWTIAGANKTAPIKRQKTWLKRSVSHWLLTRKRLVH